MAVTGKLTLRNDSNSRKRLIRCRSRPRWRGTASRWMASRCSGWATTTPPISTTPAACRRRSLRLPKAVAARRTVTLDVQYGGTITPDAARLTRMGAPADVAARNDWDQISDAFTAVRGLGYVVWYPVAIDAVSMSDGNAVFDAIARLEAAA